MKNCVIYARYSSERQTEQSIEGQLRICNDFAKQNGLQVLDTYIDRAMTGTNDNRPAFQQMLKDAEKPVMWDIVLVYAIDRFGRNSIEIAVNKQKLKKNKKMLISATQRMSENIDGTKNLDGIILENMYIGLAEYYSAELSQKIRRGLHESRQKGFCSGGRPPYGYYYKDKRVFINEEQANVVRYIFKEYFSGKIVREIINDLTEQGILYRGKAFAENTIYNFLRLEKYVGIARYDDGVYDNIYPQIVDKEVFDGVQAILAANKIGSRSPESLFLLRNKITCGCCGTHYQGDSGTSKNGTKFYYYKCMGRKKKHICHASVLKKDEFENLILEIIIKVFGTESRINYLADCVMAVYNDKLKEHSVVDLLKRDRDEVQKALDNIMRAIEQGIITETTQRRMKELEERKQTLNDKIVIAQYGESQRLTKQEIVEYLTHSLRQEPRFLLHILVKSIIVYDDKIEIYFNFTERKNPDDSDDTDSRDNNYVNCSDILPMCPPQMKKANSDIKTEFAFFFLRDFFGVRFKF